MQRTITTFTPFLFRFPANSLRFFSDEVKNQIFVGGLPWSVDNDNLRETFSKFGNCTARVIMDRETGRSRGFGFVTYDSPKEAGEAIEGMNNKDILGRRIFVNFANNNRPQRGDQSEF